MECATWFDIRGRKWFYNAVWYLLYVILSTYSIFHLNWHGIWIGKMIRPLCPTLRRATRAATRAAPARAASPTLLPSKAARAGVFGLVVEALHLLGRGGCRAPSSHSVLSRRRLRHGPKEAAFVGAGHQSHGGGRGCSGAVVNRPPRAVDAGQLNRGVLQQPR